MTYDGYYGQRSFLRADSERVLARYVVAMAHCYVMITSMFTPIESIGGALKCQRTLQKNHEMLCMTQKYKLLLYTDRNVRPKDST